MVSVEPVTATELMTITVQNHAPVLAASIANTLADILAQRSDEHYTGTAPTATGISLALAPPLVSTRWATPNWSRRWRNGCRNVAGSYSAARIPPQTSFVAGENLSMRIFVITNVMPCSPVSGTALL